MAELQTLLESLRRGEMPALGVNEVDALVGWLLGKGDEVTELPKPEHDPVLQQMVFYRLDATIFSAGELRLTAAGLGHDEPAELRKTRFRRLAGAFHPDRHPDLADWLTERSQAVLRAYGRFKHGDESIAPIQTAAPPYPGYPPPRPPRRGPFRRIRLRLRAAAEDLRRRVGDDRFLPHKLIGGLALLAMLPVLNLLLVPKPGRVEGAAVEQEMARSSEVGRNDRLQSQRVEVEPAQNAGVPGEAGEAASVEPETPPLASDNERSAGGAATYRGEEANADPALLAAVRDAMRLGESDYAHLPSVDEQLAAMGLDTDTERLYRRIRGESRPPSRARAAEPSNDESPMQSASTRASESLEASGSAKQSPARPDRAEQGSGSMPGAGTDRPSETGADAIRESEAEQLSPLAEPPAEQLADPVASLPRPELAGSELTLGLLGTHSAGTVLRDYAANIESGDLIALLTRFDRQARHGSLRGTGAIARHYQAWFERASPRRTVLKVVRVERDGERWQVETELRIEGLRGAEIVSAHDGRAIFTLAGDPLRIQRLEF